MSWKGWQLIMRFSVPNSLLLFSFSLKTISFPLFLLASLLYGRSSGLFMLGISMCTCCHASWYKARHLCQFCLCLFLQVFKDTSAACCLAVYWLSLHSSFGLDSILEPANSHFLSIQDNSFPLLTQCYEIHSWNSIFRFASKKNKDTYRKIFMLSHPLTDCLTLNYDYLHLMSPTDQLQCS